MVDSNIRKQAVWLYGVIVGLAIKESLSHVLPHIFKSQIAQMDVHIPEVMRLIMFLIICIRFYFGTVFYFDEAYEKNHVLEGDTNPPSNKYKKKNFEFDFLFGVIHFLILSALSFTINFDDASNPDDNISKYLYGIIMIIFLSYDVIWLVVNWKNETRKLIGIWAFFNVISVITCMAVFWGVWLYYKLNGIPFNFFTAEEWALLPLLVFSLLDIAELISGKQIFPNILNWCSSKLKNIGDR